MLSCPAVGSVRRATWRQYLLYLGLNVLVSAFTILIVLSLWDRRDRSPLVTPTATTDVIGQVASVVPTITPIPAPSLTPHTYTVRVGDTLSDIAGTLDVSVEALMSANRLQNANALTAGQVLIIPDGEPSGSTSDSTPTPTRTSADSGQGEVVINAIDAPGNLELEAVRLLNAGGEVSMAGWTLDDGQGQVFTFPDFTFYSTGAIDIHTRAGTNTTIDLYWGLDEAVWTAGKTIYLRDASSNLQSTFTIP
ncbi:MAG: LysM peptidoglycan-binding domain-containing protein [Anaerolineales bacterium]|nr:MAG: LysM peptidoglycan-binding domain-containing protein [Anaerolineales bacterium]